MVSWLPAVGHPGYEVSDEGDVRSVDRVVQTSTGPRRYSGQILSQSINEHGYLYVEIGKVHQLVCEAFHGPRPEGMEVRHGNGWKPDNRALNLSWGTRPENTLDQVEHGTHNNARKTHCKRGHELSPVNTRLTPQGWRSCRICERIRNRQNRNA